MNRVPIAYTINDIYTKPLMAQLVSLYEHAKESTIYDLYIISRDLSTENKQEIGNLVYELCAKAKVQFVDITSDQARIIPNIGSWGREVNYRGLLPELLPDIDKIIYLDADTLVLEDISHLAELDLDDHPYAASADVSEYNQHLVEIARIERNFVIKDIVLTHGYINTGVLVINLAYWRQHHWQSEFIRLLNIFVKYRVDVFPDQDALNYLAIRDGINRIYYLPSTYNSLFTHNVSSITENHVHFDMTAPSYDWYSHVRMIYRNRYLSKNLDARIMMDRVVIIHFCSWKPWVATRGSDHFVSLFTPYAQRVGLLIPPKSSPAPQTALEKVKDSLRLQNLFRKYKKEKLIIFIIFSLGVTSGYLLSIF
ncbi:glycosyltransferase family 8 protein [Entomospira entomophila]|uniref:Glycosyltransferase family 8 protein n=1 Tax=Entomospira entomophila TaxID=2719988 RepID=A0A968KQZ3_9SPIO|nr:glycosyltransferase family 8 protein [Entomospira entomophilus]NIZ40198.1 glycosyltransferase family 8 protein [Entomospira entomophilus]WDI35757.1 glycosyltransferase family 8 protein [Entomospira entomophilus]